VSVRASIVPKRRRRGEGSGAHTNERPLRALEAGGTLGVREAELVVAPAGTLRRADDVEHRCLEARAADLAARAVGDAQAGHADTLADAPREAARRYGRRVDAAHFTFWADAIPARQTAFDGRLDGGLAVGLGWARIA